MQLKPQDIVVLLKLVCFNKEWNYRLLANELFMSTGEVHNALERARQAQLYDAETKRPRFRSLEEFLIHGVKYAFPAQRGALTRGIPTAFAAAPLNQVISSSKDEPAPVWPDPEGSQRGYSLEPLFSSVPKAAKKDKALYELLALVDAVRDGRARERKLATEHLQIRLRQSDEKA